MKGTILVVDDDPQILEVLDIRLSSLGLEVTATGDPGHAVAIAASIRLDAALVDLRMGPPDGMLLTEATIESAVQAIQRGAFDYLTKPFIPGELQGKIARALSVRRWARDRERLLVIGEILASSGNLALVLEAVAKAAMESIDAARCVVFQREADKLVAVASAGVPGQSRESLEGAAAQAMDKGAPLTVLGTDGGLLVAAPLVVERGPAGALVIETSSRVEPGQEDLELLALFSAQAAGAIRTTHEYQRLRGGALTALGRMATQVAHELRNPLAGILLYARHLEHRLARGGDGEGAETARKISTAVERLGAVVSEITAFGRPPALHRARVALPPLLDECLTFARARHPTGSVEIAQRYDPACPEAFVDARELRKAFLNLILNALEALDRPGRLTISTIYTAATGGVTVRIEDTGGGMSAETLARAFDMFFTTKPEGTGLGMAIARSVIERHGGELRLESLHGRGTTVSVRLPVDGRFAAGAAADL
jgi:signal transduction histidine kinase